MRALLVIVLLAATAEARGLPQGGGWLHYELSGAHALDDDTATPRELVLAGVKLHGLVGGRYVAYHAGLDLAAGATIQDAGFAYDVSLFPVGGALRLGASGFLAVGFGIGANGATGTLDDALAFPLDVTLEVGGGAVRLLAHGRGTFLFNADSRQGGARTLGGFDELEAMAGVRIGRSKDQFGFTSSTGYFVGVNYRELLDTRMVGLVIGYAIAGGSLRKPRHVVDL
ncbi:MAG: hypothetical protein SFX73_02535 [Kofleriaceae bacterium]|nr:hypothetical protein [Kofleriaceae bacterium]